MTWFLLSASMVLMISCSSQPKGSSQWRSGTGDGSNLESVFSGCETKAEEYAGEKEWKKHQLPQRPLVGIMEVEEDKFIRLKLRKEWNLKHAEAMNKCMKENGFTPTNETDQTDQETG